MVMKTETTENNLFDSAKDKTNKFITEFSKNKLYRKMFRLEFLLVFDPSAKFLTFFQEC